MTASIKEMHYQFKSKLNKIDSPANVNYRIPEIDWKLRKAEFQFIKDRVVQSNQFYKGSFEFNTRIIDDLKNIIVIGTTVINSPISNANYKLSLPEDYFYFVECKAKCTKGGISKIIPCFVRNNNEEIFAFNTSSFEWEELNLIFLNKQIMLISDGTFTINEIYLKYIKVPSLSHNAEDYYGTVSVLGSEILDYYSTYNRVPKGLTVSISSVDPTTSYTINGYVTLNKEKLFGYMDPELSQNTSEEIVDIAIKESLLSISEKSE